MKTQSALLFVTTIVACLVPVDRVFAQARETATVESSITVLNEVAALPAKAIPAALLRDAQGVAIVPGIIKAGFVVGGRFGRGVVIVRDEQGNWCAPIFITVTGGSVGWQIGAQSSDIVLVFKSRRSLDGILQGKKFTLGGDAAVAAGPVGRQAEAGTDVQLQAEIYSYARSRGLFAGVSLEGTAILVDNKADAAYYGQPAVTPNDIITGQGINPRQSCIKLLDTLAGQAAMADAGQ